MRKTLAFLLSLLLTAPAFAGCGAACYPGEEQIGLWPTVVADLVAQAATASNTYFDQQQQAYNWSTSSAPTLSTSVDSTLFSAWTPASSSVASGSGVNITANFAGPNGGQAWPLTGDFTLVIVADVNASQASANTYALAGSTLGTANGWLLGVKNNHAVAQVTGAGVTLTGSATLATGVPTAIILAWSSVDQTLALMTCPAGGSCSAWATASLFATIQASTLADATLMIGNVGFTGAYLYWGNLFRVLLFKESLQNSAKAAQLAYLQAILAAKY
jgi:hypothetical protein